MVAIFLLLCPPFSASCTGGLGPADSDGTASVRDSTGPIVGTGFIGEVPKEELVIIVDGAIAGTGPVMEVESRVLDIVPSASISAAIDLICC